jgi:hypothetical protein
MQSLNVRKHKFSEFLPAVQYFSKRRFNSICVPFFENATRESGSEIKVKTLNRGTGLFLVEI